MPLARSSYRSLEGTCLSMALLLGLSCRPRAAPREPYRYEYVRWITKLASCSRTWSRTSFDDDDEDARRSSSSVVDKWLPSTSLRGVDMYVFTFTLCLCTTKTRLNNDD